MVPPTTPDSTEDFAKATALRSCAIQSTVIGTSIIAPIAATSRPITYPTGRGSIMPAGLTSRPRLSTARRAQRIQKRGSTTTKIASKPSRPISIATIISPMAASGKSMNVPVRATRGP